MFLMGPLKQLKRMCDKTRAFATIVMIVSYSFLEPHTNFLTNKEDLPNIFIIMSPIMLIIFMIQLISYW